MVEFRWDVLDVGGDTMLLFDAIPDGLGPFPAVVVNQGLGSVEATIQELTRRVAEAGFVAAAPVYYHRQKDNILRQVSEMTPGTPERTKRLFEKVKQLRDVEVMADGIAAIEHLKSVGEVEPNERGGHGVLPGWAHHLPAGDRDRRVQGGGAVLPGRCVDGVGRWADRFRAYVRHLVSGAGAVRARGR
jgi:fermentation-respiration switch protein FrsA (DUF1100 family)